VRSMHVAVYIVAPLLWAAASLAQDTTETGDGCMRLVGSSACPGCELLPALRIIPARSSQSDASLHMHQPFCPVNPR